ncbi:nucleoside/nucleotide kinase family protein [Salinibacterium sp. G-O1]|uniref:nucleoside/nucleotide kinase family protein n=1 Tax=Salinibacterium sp. G-O1 TaxID=3046208 RepID=UPI0024B9186D|nr:nucleoside/nucleotide kinase family protein [Salinibacterium sp. G-O1]MDJ0333806.1 nucleoside/nucleotide kinase family protein [Salinibacterium sp. G-O1]
MILSSFTEVVDLVLQARAATPAARRLLVGIVGPPGAGKSTIAAAIVERLPTAALLPMDGFHLPQAELRRLGRRERMGAPDTFDVDGFVATLADVRNSCNSVAAPGFDRGIEEPVAGAITIPQELSTVVVDGNYLLLWERAAELLDLTFFVEVEHDTRIDRLVERHERFGKTSEQARAWALGPDEANATVIAATAASADHVIRL